MTKVLITGSVDGLGRAAAQALLERGHEVVVHGRTEKRLDAVRDLLDAGAHAVVGDLADLDQTHSVAEQVASSGMVDAVIHNAGVYRGPAIMPVNVVAPYVLTALMPQVERLVYLSSGMHRGAKADVTGVDWTGARAGSYSDSKLFVATLAAAVARRWPDVVSNSVDPGWVPTRMGGPGAPDDLRLGHFTQEWLATSNDRQALTSGGYWYHRQRRDPDAAVHDVQFQDQLLAALAQHTGVVVPEPT
ncbi:SDR family NAD(P)-dependent oxidoreductase [Pedococcus sp. P5_B7]